MKKLFGMFLITATASSPLYKPGDKAFGVYFYRKLLPSTTVLIQTATLRGIYTISHLDHKEVWLKDSQHPKNVLGPFPLASVKAVMIGRFRPRHLRKQT